MAKPEESSENSDANEDVHNMDKEVAQEAENDEHDIDETETKVASEDDPNGPPIDRGWAWVVLAGTFGKYIEFYIDLFSF